jgi:hypothetical protein
VDQRSVGGDGGRHLFQALVDAPRQVILVPGVPGVAEQLSGSAYRGREVSGTLPCVVAITPNWVSDVGVVGATTGVTVARPARSRESNTTTGSSVPNGTIVSRL